MTVTTMEVLCQELGVPRKQIRETNKSDRLMVIVHQSWIKCLVEQKRVAKFPVHAGFGEWPDGDTDLGNSWKLTYFMVNLKTSNKIYFVFHDLNIIPHFAGL